MKRRYIEAEVRLAGMRYLAAGTPIPWRRFQIFGGASLHDLHMAIQIVCDWTDSHLYSFEDPDGTLVGASSVMDDWPDGARLHVGRSWDQLTYTYDFGDNWELDVRLEHGIELNEEFRLRLLDGDHAFPLEDVGGPPGYGWAMDVIARADAGEDLDDEDEQRLEWLGDWRPNDFDLAALAARAERT